MNKTKEKKLFIKKQKGITLIALVITIIVLLILAGTTIITLTGDNGILRKATDASFATKEAEELDRVKLMTTAAKLDELGLDIKDITIRKAANNEFKEDGYLLEETSDKSGFKFTVKESQRNYYISKNGLVEKYESYSERIAGNQPEEPEERVYLTSSNIKSSPSLYYGKNVNYEPEVKNQATNINEKVTGWKIFYADDNNIYLISQDYIKCDLMPAVGVNRPHYISDGNNPRANFDNYDLRQVYRDGSSNVNSTAIRWLDQHYNSNFASANDNMQITAYLMDTVVWNGYVKSDIADYAIGSPTLQMIAASYNSLHPDTIITQAQSATGYRVKNANGNMETWNNGLDRNNPLYVADPSIVLWIASPSDAGGDCLVNLYPGDNNSGAGIGSDNFYANNNGLRPVVRLNNDVKITLSEDKISYDIVK